MLTAEEKARSQQCTHAFVSHVTTTHHADATPLCGPVWGAARPTCGTRHAAVRIELVGMHLPRVGGSYSAQGPSRTKIVQRDRQATAS